MEPTSRNKSREKRRTTKEAARVPGAFDEDRDKGGPATDQRRGRRESLTTYDDKDINTPEELAAWVAEDPAGAFQHLISLVQDQQGATQARQDELLQQIQALQLQL